MQLVGLALLSVEGVERGHSLVVILLLLGLDELLLEFELFNDVNRKLLREQDLLVV